MYNVKSFTNKYNEMLEVEILPYPAGVMFTAQNCDKTSIVDIVLSESQVKELVEFLQGFVV